MGSSLSFDNELIEVWSIYAGKDSATVGRERRVWEGLEIRWDLEGCRLSDRLLLLEGDENASESQ